MSFSNCKEDKKEEKVPEVTKEWIQLFNGEDLNDWIVKIKGYPLNENIYNTFRVENGVLKVSYDGYENFNDTYGHIFYKKSFSSYKLRLQYRFIGNQVKGGEGWAEKNSGVMIHSQSPESMGINQAFPVSIEVQLLGGLNEDEERPTANLCTPGTHIMVNGKLVTTHCINSSSKTYYYDQWVNLEVLVIPDSIITHKINGKEVLSYSKPQIGGNYNILKAREGELLKEGYISLQSESHPIEFRNIELLEID
ncbi:MAG: DUF1080 domain-containing protein [Flavobacteriaceae bacterium]|nr:DUF1080 domain-containing protein [Flavobacteriaceae bacterium]